MDARSILMAQIQTLEQELGRAESALNNQQIDSKLRERVRSRFELLIKKQWEALKMVQESADKGQQPLDLCWSSFETIRQDCENLFREYFAFIQGTLVRRAGLDTGLCRIADALLDDLSHRADIFWGRFTILAEGEFFQDMAEIIRLRFPEVSIWNLPVAAHEFGHFLGPELEEHDPDGRSRHPFQDLLEREKQRKQEQKGLKYWFFLHEHFADIFATYALGPAYACTCILLRFDPGIAYQDQRYHPSFAKRVYCILKVLDKMDKEEGGLGRPYQGIIEVLEELWQQCLVATGQPKALDQVVTIPLDTMLDELYHLVHYELPPGIRYEGWLRAQNLSAELQPNLQPKKYARLVWQGKGKLADVLNAAWLCRLQHWDGDSYAVSKIGDRAYELCHQIIGHRK